MADKSFVTSRGT